MICDIINLEESFTIYKKLNVSAMKLYIDQLNSIFCVRCIDGEISYYQYPKVVLKGGFRTVDWQSLKRNEFCQFLFIPPYKEVNEDYVHKRIGY